MTAIPFELASALKGLTNKQLKGVARDESTFKGSMEGHGIAIGNDVSHASVREFIRYLKEERQRNYRTRLNHARIHGKSWSDDAQGGADVL